MSEAKTLIGSQKQTFVHCPKHGKHPHSITSTIPGHQGDWCQICWIETLGEPLQTSTEPYQYGLPEDEK